MDKRTRQDPYRLIGATFGQYKLVELIGIGGMGAVYRAEHIVVGYSVALKLLKPDLASESPKTRRKLEELFLIEAKNTLRLKHEYIVRVLHVDVSDHVPYLLMEWLDGQTLEKELEQEQTLSPSRVATLLDQICQGVAHAHAKEIVHRDLKPGNIMILKDSNDNETVKILDFGIAKALNSTNSRIIGAPHYSSPEQLNLGSTIDARSDVYSLGVMLYELLTGKLPFDADSIGQIVRQHMSESPTRLREIRTEISQAVEAVVLKAMAKDPAQRYQGVMEMARAFRVAANLDTGQLTLQCVAAGLPLAGAAVYLDGRYQGKTKEDGQWQQTNLLPGTYSLEIQGHGYLDFSERITIEAQENRLINVELLVQPAGKLRIRAMEADSGVPLAGAELVLNGQVVGVTGPIGLLCENKLAPGKLNVLVRHPQRRFKFSGEVEIVQDRETALDVEFPAEVKRPWPGPGTRILRFAVPLVVVIAVLIGVITLVRFNAQSNLRDELLDNLLQASHHNNAGLTLFETAQSNAVSAVAVGMDMDAANKPLLTAAVSEFEKATSLDPGRIDYYANLGSGLLFSSEFERAQQVFEKLAKNDPGQTEYRLNSDVLRSMLSSQNVPGVRPLTRYYLERGDYFQKKANTGDLANYRVSYRCAEFEYRKASELDRRNPQIYSLLAAALEQQSNFNDAYYRLGLALQLNPQNASYSKQRNELKEILWNELSANSNTKSEADENRDYFKAPCRP